MVVPAGAVHRVARIVWRQVVHLTRPIVLNVLLDGNVCQDRQSVKNALPVPFPPWANRVKIAQDIKRQMRAAIFVTTNARLGFTTLPILLVLNVKQGKLVLWVVPRVSIA